MKERGAEASRTFSLGAATPELWRENHNTHSVTRPPVSTFATGNRRSRSGSADDFFPAPGPKGIRFVFVIESVVFGKISGRRAGCSRRQPH